MGRVIRIGARAVPVVAMSLYGLIQVGPASAAAPVACGTVITSSMTLGNDVLNCTGDGLIIGADRVKLNLNGHKVTGVVTSSGIAVGQNAGVRLRDTTGSAVSNGEVSGFAAGVRVDDGMYNKVTGIYTHGNIGNDNSGDNGDGIALWNASKNTVEGNRVVNNGPYGGVSLVTGPYNSPNDPSMFATDNIVRNNVIDDNNVSPCTAGSVAVPGKCTPRSKVDGTALPRVDRGMLTVGGNDDGIRIEGPNVSGTKVSGNMVTGSGNNGIFLQPSCKNAFGPPPTPTGTPRCQGDVGNVDSVVTGNTSNHNGYGRATGSGINMFAMGVPQVIPAGHATMSGNTVMQNYSDGITLTSVCDGLPTDPLETCVPHANMIDNNNASGNRRNGILLDAKTHDNRLEANKVNSNGNIGISMLLALDYSGSGPVYPPIPGTGPMNNVLRMNTGTGNTTMDAVDPTPGCGTNSWIGNVFGTMNQHCVGEP